MLPGKRLLICGPVFPTGDVGGLQLALRDLASSLEERGWDVDLAVTPERLGLRDDSRAPRLRGLAHARWSRLPRLRFLPDDVRTVLQHVLLDGGFARVQSDLMRTLEGRIRGHQYDAVIACIPREAPGLARFITDVHPNTILLSLEAIPGELRRRRWLALPRLVARTVGRTWSHPAIYRAVDPARAGVVVFASDAWRQEALAAGLPPHAARTIYFGLRDVPPLPPPRPVANRLLWVGRLSREKGLHFYIEALPLLRRHRPVTVTAVCGQGPSDYRHAIERRIEQLGLDDVVQLLPAVPREALADFYRTHDALLFHSVFSEPVALVVAEAFAAGLPVIAPAPRGPSALLIPGTTAMCFGHSDPQSIAATALRTLEDDEQRLRIRKEAHALVRREFSLDRMASAWEEVLEERLGARVSCA